MDHINEDMIKSLLENRMSRVAQAQVRHHIRTCFRCEEKLKEWRASFEALSGEESPKAKTEVPVNPLGSEPTILVPAQPITLSRHSRRVMKSVLAVALIVVIALVVDSFRQGRLPKGAEGATGPVLIEGSEAALQEGVGPEESVVPDSVTQDSSAASVDRGLETTPAPVRAQDESATVLAPSEEVPSPAPAPAARRPLAPAPGFSMITVREAIEQKGGPLHVNSRLRLALSSRGSIRRASRNAARACSKSPARCSVLPKL